MKLADTIAATIGLIISVYVYYEISSFPTDQVMQVGPDFFPRILTIGLGFFSLVLLITSRKSTAPDNESSFDIRDKGIQRAAISVAMTVIFCLALDPVGFLVSSFVFLLSLMLLLKERNYLQMILVAGAVTGIIYLIFKMFLDITLPLGTLYGY